MKTGVIKRIDKGDLSKAGDLPSWIDALLQPLNDAIEKFGTALSGKLTVRDNFLGNIVSQKLTSGVEKEINPYPSGVKGKVIGVLPYDTNGSEWTSFNWTRKTNGNIGVKIGLVSATDATVVLRIDLEN